jgi:hypothetical protein
VMSYFEQGSTISGVLKTRIISWLNWGAVSFSRKARLHGIHRRNLWRRQGGQMLPPPNIFKTMNSFYVTELNNDK